MALADRLVALVVAGEPHGHRLEPVLGDLEARAVVEDGGAEHQLVVELGLDQDDVDARIALLPLLDRDVQALVGEQPEGLVADRREPHVGDAAGAGAGDGRDALPEVVRVGHQRVDDDDELGAVLDRDIDIGGRADAAVDELAAVDLDRRVDHRQRARGGHRGRDRDVGPIALAEHHSLGGIEVGRGQVQLGIDQPEVVASIGVREHLGDVILEPTPGVDAGRQSAGQAGGHVDGRQLAQVADQFPRHSGYPQREGERLANEAAVVGFQQGAERDVAQRRRQLAVQHPHHLLGGDPVRHHAGHERPRAGSHVDVELVDGAVDRQQVERSQGADLVDAAGEAPAAEDERGLRSTLATFSAPSRPRVLSGGLELDDLAHGDPHYAARTGRPRCLARGRGGVRAQRLPCRGAGKAVWHRAGRARLRAPARPCRGPRLHLALPAASRAREPNAARGEAQRRLGDGHERAKQPHPVHVGLAHGSRPRLEHEAVHDRGRARPLRRQGAVDDQVVRGTQKRPAPAHAQGQAW